MICSIGGVPLLYLGEEWGVLNDYDYVKDPAKAGDSRWVHRPRVRWEYLADLDPSRSFQHYLRQHDGARLIALANFSESDQSVDSNMLRTHGPGRFFTDRWSGESIAASAGVSLPAYGFRWLVRA